MRNERKYKKGSEKQIKINEWKKSLRNRWQKAHELGSYAHINDSHESSWGWKRNLLEILTHLVGGLIPLWVEIAQLICRLHYNSAVVGIHKSVRCSESTDIQVIKKMTKEKN